MSRILSGPEAIAEAIDALRCARPVAFPTETVYGLGADAMDADAVAAVFALKGRPANNPLIVHVSGIEMARPLVRTWTEQADAIARAHWPGAVTIVLPKADCVPGIVCADGDTVAIRCPAHPMALALIEAFAKPIVGPSANPSGRISPTIPEHVQAGFSNEEDLIIIDGGACHAGVESTVLDLSADQPLILRRGVVAPETLSNTLGVEVRVQTEPLDDRGVRSPGMLGAHYQPRTPCRLVTLEQIRGLDSARIALISWSAQPHPRGGVLVEMPPDAARYAAELYAALHRADGSASEEIWIESPPVHLCGGTQERAIWDAVLERVARATQSG